MTGTATMSRGKLDEASLDEISQTCDISQDAIEDIYDCSPLQVATVAESSIHPGASVFQFVFSLAHTIDLDCFCRALHDVVALNSILRTRFVNGRLGLVQVVVREHLYVKRPEVSLNEYLMLDKKRGLALGMPLFRSAIIERKLVLTMHHGIMDHASLTPLFEDVLAIYHGKPPKERARFKEFVAHCNRMDESLAKSFWGSQFRGAPTIYPKVHQGYLPLATHVVNRQIVLSQVGDSVSLAHIPSFIEVAWALTASTYAGSDSVAFGMILSGRTSSACAATETTLGPTIVVIPVQVIFQRSSTLEGMLKDRNAARRQLQTHPSLHYGLARIRAVNEAAKIAAGFQTLLNIRPRWYEPAEASEISLDQMNEPHGAFALSLSCDLHDNGISLEAACDPAVLGDNELNRILRQFEHFLQLLTQADPATKLAQLPRLNLHDLSQILEWNRQLNPQTTEKCVHDLFEEQVQQRPDALAVNACDGKATYAELNDMSDRLALELRRRGVSVEAPVALLFDKSIWIIVATLGVMKAGGACVPIAASDPLLRINAILSTADVEVVLTSSAQYCHASGLAPTVLAITAELISGLPSPNDTHIWCQSPTSLAYILFTSGSTGTPKGVMLEHRNLSSSLNHLVKLCGYGELCRMLQFASYAWDISIGEIFITLVSGGCLLIPSEEDRSSDLSTYIENKNANCAILTPTVIQTLTPEDVPSLGLLFSIGEPVSPDASTTWGKALRFVNGWGPTEASILSTVAELTPNSLYPETIGQPLNSVIWIVNPKDANDLAPIGSIGEVLVDGPGVARGYLKDEKRTKASFIKPPVWASSCQSEQRHLFRTGDLAKYNTDGSICFIGRQDCQVKVRGQRFELGEVESVLLGCDKVQNAFATTKIVEGRTELIAVMCLADATLPRQTSLQEISDDHAEVKVHHIRVIQDLARSSLPLYMVPTIWLVVERLPQTASAKVDRECITSWLKTKGLSAARVTLESNHGTILTKPHTKEEEILHSAWQSILHLPREKVGLESLFIQLGGDSILAMRVATECRKRGIIVHTASLLGTNTLAQIAKSSRPASATGPTKGSAKTSSTHRDAINERMTVVKKDINAKLAAQKNIQISIEAIVPATDSQAIMLAAGEIGRKGYYMNFDVGCGEGVEVLRLREACERVAQQHGILRTAFFQHKSSLYQVVLTMPPKDVVIQDADENRLGQPFHEGVTLAHFCLFSEDGGRCDRLRLAIHHALYDAISIGLILSDLDAAYTGQSLSDGPQFHSWVSNIERLDVSDARRFWKDNLVGSQMPYLIPSVPGDVRGHPLDDISRIHVPLASIKSQSGTPSSVVKAAWSLLIAQALGTTDVLFGEVSANRYTALYGIEKVKGPCVNTVPVRAYLDPSKTLESLVRQIHDLSTNGMSHHLLGTRSIVRECTSWPRWTRFSTAVVYQNHDSFKEVVKIGNTACQLSVTGRLGDVTDIHVIATPVGEDLEIELRFSSLVFPDQQVQWISSTFSKILNEFHLNLERSISEVQATLRCIGCDYIVPSTSSFLLSPVTTGDITLSLKEAYSIVADAWGDLELPTLRQDSDVTIWDCGGDIVTALLLSESYNSRGYSIPMGEIIKNPSQRMQALVVASKHKVQDGPKAG